MVRTLNIREETHEQTQNHIPSRIPSIQSLRIIAPKSHRHPCCLEGTRLLTKGHHKAQNHKNERKIAGKLRGRHQFLIKGKLSDDDFKEHLIPVMDETIKSHGKIRILFQMEDVEGITTHGVWDDIITWPKLRFAERMGFVTDETGSELSSRFVGPAILRFISPVPPAYTSQNPAIFHHPDKQIGHCKILQ